MARLGARPVLLIHSTSDQDIPVSHAYALQQAGRLDPNLEVWITTGPGHVRSFKSAPALYLQHVLTFFDKYLTFRSGQLNQRS